MKNNNEFTVKQVIGILFGMSVLLSGCATLETDASNAETRLEAELEAASQSETEEITVPNRSGDWQPVEKTVLSTGDKLNDVSKQMVIFRHVPTGTMVATTASGHSGYTVLPFTYDEYLESIQ